MSTFEREEFKWRETYFVLFDSSKRPTLKHVEEVLAALSDRFELTDARADEDGRFESITVLSPDDYAALDISFLAGEEVLEQNETLEKELKEIPLDADERRKLARIKECDARFDLLHFEQQADDGPAIAADEPDEMLDPSTLLIVLDSMVEMTGGIGVDPQSGTFL
ncbi:MAG: hypothetical protein DWQ37_11965 [Planctomycetota bacterium]|nr:MAG: hypothetical protein DWQ37_11965 [Planctomycetota bacterium]